MMPRCLPVVLVQAEPQARGGDVTEFADHVPAVPRRLPLGVHPDSHLFGADDELRWRPAGAEAG